MNDYSLKNTDFIYNKVGNKVTSLGFKVNNSLLGIKPAMIGGGFKKEGDNTTLAVPAILAKFHNLVQENSNTLKKVGAGQPEVVDNNLYDKLLDLMNTKSKSTPNPKKAYKESKKKYTRKKMKIKGKGKRKRKTRKK
jgi:hypothetical protein